jgi:hypothetical protein
MAGETRRDNVRRHQVGIIGLVCLQYGALHCISFGKIVPALSLGHVHEVRPRKVHSGVDLISDALPFGRLWYAEANAVSNAVDYAKFRSRSNDGPVSI